MHSVAQQKQVHSTGRMQTFTRLYVAIGNDISQVRAGVSARPRAEDENIHLHARRSGLSQG